jgi:hypothetical protein
LAKASIERTECQKDVTFLIIVGNIPEMPNLKRPGDSSLSRFSSISSFSHRRRRLAGQSKTTKFSAGINWSLNQIIKKQKIQKWQRWQSIINICQRRGILSNLTLPKTDNENHQTTCHSDYKTHTAPVSPGFCPSSCSLCRASMVEPCICERGTCRQGKVTANPARQSQTPGFHPKPQLLPKDIKIFHILQNISEMLDLKRPLRFKLFQIFQHLQLSPPAETPGVVNLRPPGFQPGST